MESIRNWAWMLCGAAVLCGALNFLLPSGSSKKAGKLVSALVFLSCLLMPLKDGFSVEFPQMSEEQAEHSEELQQQEEKLAYSIAQSHILKLIRTALEDEAIPLDDIQLSLTEDSLTVKLKLSSSLQSREQEIRCIIKDSFGAEKIEIQWQEEAWTETGKPSAQP